MYDFIIYTSADNLDDISDHIYTSADFRQSRKTFQICHRRDAFPFFIYSPKTNTKMWRLRTEMLTKLF